MNGALKKLLPEELFSLWSGQKDYLSVHKRKKWLRTIYYKSIVGCCMATLTACFIFIVYKAAIDSELFHINEVIISDTQHIKKETIISLIKKFDITSMIQPTSNGLGAEIAQLPWVKKAEVEKIWPSTLRITITEHTPLALVNLAGEEHRVELYYVTDDGNIFWEANGDHSIDFPIITGEVSENGPDTTIDPDDAFERALHFLRLSTSSSILHTHLISEVNIGSDGELTIYLINHIFPIRLGKGNMSDCFTRLSSVLDDLRKNNELDKINKITMDYYDKQILVTMNESIR